MAGRARDGERVAGVSSFGMTGVSAHAVMRAAGGTAGVAAVAAAGEAESVLVLSAWTGKSFAGVVEKYASADAALRPAGAWCAAMAQASPREHVEMGTRAAVVFCDRRAWWRA